MTVLGDMAQSIVDRLAPLRSAELVVRRPANSQRQQGASGTNGVATLVLENVTGLPAGQGMGGTTQNASANWLLRCQLKNLQSAESVEHFFDWVTEHLFGWTPTGGTSPITLGSFTPGTPIDEYWPLEIRFSTMMLLINETFEEPGEVDAGGANLLDLVFCATVEDRWGENTAGPITIDPDES